VHTQPAESNGVCYDTHTDQDPGAKRAEVCKCADEKEDDDLNGEGDTVAEKDDGIDCSVSTRKVENLAITSRLRE